MVHLQLYPGYRRYRVSRGLQDLDHHEYLGVFIPRSVYTSKVIPLRLYLWGYTSKVWSIYLMEYTSCNGVYYVEYIPHAMEYDTWSNTPRYNTTEYITCSITPRYNTTEYNIMECNTYGVYLMEYTSWSIYLMEYTSEVCSGVYSMEYAVE
jgi:hypothetical protein